MWHLSPCSARSDHRRTLATRHAFALVDAVAAANFLHAPAFEACWSVFPLAVILAAAWVRYVWLAADWDFMHLSFISGNNGLRIARVLYGLSLIFFGTAHFIDLKDTVSLIPNWLPGHLFWAYFTGCTFLAAGVAVLIGFHARLPAALSALQISLFLLLVWISF
jgi:hypothetical protein